MRGPWGSLRWEWERVASTGAEVTCVTCPQIGRFGVNRSNRCKSVLRPNRENPGYDGFLIDRSRHMTVPLLGLHMSAPLSLDEEARLYTTNAERERYESLATLYGIVVALDYLERAYVRDSVTAAECVIDLNLSVVR